MLMAGLCNPGEHLLTFRGFSSLLVSSTVKEWRPVILKGPRVVNEASVSAAVVNGRRFLSRTGSYC